MVGLPILIVLTLVIGGLCICDCCKTGGENIKCCCEKFWLVIGSIFLVIFGVLGCVCSCAENFCDSCGGPEIVTIDGVDYIVTHTY